MVRRKKQIRILAAIAATLLISACALQLPPTGGEVDKTPPQIIEVYPPDGTLNYDEDYFEITFSEYIQNRSLRNAIFISPFIDGALDIDFGGKSATINFPEPLRDSVTYNITIGTDVVDYNNSNRMASSFHFKFSTGDVIDNGRISGTVYDREPSGVMLMAYKVEDDSVQPFTRKPDYISQAGEKGDYQLDGLAEGTYRVFAVRDQLKNLLFEPGQDQIGVPSTDVVLTREDSSYQQLNFYLSEMDTTAPMLISAAMTDKYHLLVETSEKVDSASVSALKYTIYDSTAVRVIEPIYAYRGRKPESELVLVLNDSIPLDNSVYLFASGMTDEEGNRADADIYLTPGDRPDTTAPDVLSLSPRARSGVEFYKPEFTIQFNDAVITDSLQQSIHLAHLKDSSAVELKVSCIDDASLRVKAQSDLEPDTDYQLTVDLSLFRDAAGNRADTTFVHKFTTFNDIDYTGASGTIVNLDTGRNALLLLEHSKIPEKVYITKPEADSTFSFDEVLPGDYQLKLIYDEDNNGKYSYGEIFPFVPSEEVQLMNDLLELPERWAVNEIEFILKKHRVTGEAPGTNKEESK